MAYLERTLNYKGKRMSNYIDEAREELSKHIKVGKGLMRVYTVLLLTKGEETTLKDVHDAWSVNINETWDRDTLGEHWSLIPFNELKKETQDKDQGYVDGIHKAAKELKRRGLL